MHFRVHIKFKMSRINKRIIASFGVLFLLVVFAFAIRSFGLTKIPVFADEAIYIRWSQVMRAEPTLRFLPLSDGKQPLFMWVVIPFLKIFHNPLISGRFVSVLSGIGTLLGIASLSFVILRSKKAALLSAFLYALSPFMFFFDRMSLVDSLLSLFGVWFFVFLITSIKYLRWDFSMLAGFALGAALLTKSPALFFLLMTPLSIFFAPWGRGKNLKVSLQIIGLWLTTVVIGYGLSQIMRLGPNFQMIAIRNLDYVFPISHILTNTKDPFIFNLDRALEWIVQLAPFEVFLLAILGYFAAVKKLSFKILLLVIAFAFPLLVGSMYSKAFTARYILFTLPPLFVLAGFTTLFKKRWYLIIVGLFVLHAAYFDWLLITNPVSAPLPESERSGYFEEWSSGFGLAETADFIKLEVATHPEERIVVGTEGYFGTLPDGLQMYLEKIPNVVVLGTGLNFKKIPDPLVEARKSGAKVYFVVNSSRLNSEFKTDGLILRYSFKKPTRMPGTHEYVAFGPDETFYFFELN